MYFTQLASYELSTYCFLKLSRTRWEGYCNVKSTVIHSAEHSLQYCTYVANPIDSKTKHSKRVNTQARNLLLLLLHLQPSG